MGEASATRAPAGVVDTVANTAGIIEQGLENVMKVEPEIAGVASIFVPQIGMIQPWIVMLAPSLERALKAVATKNGTDLFQALPELLSHISKGLPNSPALGPSESTQGSG